LNQEADLWATNIKYDQKTTKFEVYNRDGKLGDAELQIPGRHNVLNALAAIAVGLELEIGFKIIAGALQTFKGVERRFDILGIVNDIMVVNDYAHHPTEIAVTLQAAKNGWNRRIVAVFQPHLFSRTRDFYREFAEALKIADLTVVTEIYPAREEPIAGVTGKLVADALAENSYYFADKSSLPEFLKQLTQPGDMVLFLGAGDIYLTAKKFKQMLEGV